MSKTISLTRVKNDINGNPRYVVHFLGLLSKQDNAYIENHYNNSWCSANTRIREAKNLALRKAKLIGGKEYRGKDFGGGIVFQSYNIGDLIKDLEHFAKDEETECGVCENTFTVTAEPSISYNCQRQDGDWEETEGEEL